MGSAYRADALRKLVDEPSDRDTLREAKGASKAIIARLLSEFEERNWVDRDGHQYELTDPGHVVAEVFLELVDTVETERLLRDVWQYLPTELSGFIISLFDAAVVAFTEAGAS